MPDSNYASDNHIGGKKQICPQCSDGKKTREAGGRSCLFYTKKGDLTPYAFSCGYIEVRGGFTDQTRSTLSKEHGFYHVRVPAEPQDERPIYRSYDTLREARALFRTSPKEA